MPSFVFRAKNAADVTIDDRIEAATLGQARYTLELRGHRDIEFYSPENAADIQRAFIAGTGVDLPAEEIWSAEREIAAQKRKGLASQLLWAAGQHCIYFGPLLLWNYFSWRGTRPFGWGDWLGFVLTPLYFFVFGSMVLPMAIFTELLEAAVWQDWRKQHRCIRLARLMRRLMRVGIPENELIFREANALAAEGNLAGALAKVEPLRKNPDLAEYLWLGRVASLYEFAGDFRQQLRCIEEAVAKSPGGADPWIDLAAVHIRRFRNVPAARSALAEAEQKELSEIARGVLLLTKGMVSVEAGDFAQAEQELRESETILAKFGIALIRGMEAELRAYLALALSAQNRAMEGRAGYARGRPLLVARKMEQLISRADKALAGT